jgi:hypothetical protein
MAKKITQYPASGGNPDVGSLIDISELSGGVYTSKKLTIQQLLAYLTSNLNINQVDVFTNETGSTLPVGIPCEIYQTSVTNIPSARPISVSNSTSGLSEIFIPTGAVLNLANGNFVKSGVINMNTQSWVAGSKLFWDFTTSTLTNTATLEDQIFVGIVLQQGTFAGGGKIFASPTRPPQLIKGTAGQVPLFMGERKINGNTHFTFVDTNGTEVGFRFSDDSNNLTQVGVTYINVESEGTASNSVLRLANWANNANKGIVSFRKSRGTKAIPTRVLAQDVLGSIIYAGQSDKTFNGGAPFPSGMTTGEIIVRALNNFIKNYDAFSDETFSQGLTQFEIWLQESNAVTTGDLTPPNIKVFSVDGDGKVSFKNYTFPIANGSTGQVLTAGTGGQATWTTPTGGVSGGQAGRITGWTDATTLEPLVWQFDDALYQIWTVKSAYEDVYISPNGGVQIDGTRLVGQGAQSFQGFKYRLVTDSTQNFPTLRLVSLQDIVPAIEFAPVGQKMGRIEFDASTSINAFSAGIEAIATEGQTLNTKGTDLRFYTTPNGTQNPLIRFIIHEDGRYSIGNVKYPSTAGLGGQVLQITALNEATWVTPPNAGGRGFSPMSLAMCDSAPTSATTQYYYQTTAEQTMQINFMKIWGYSGSDLVRVGIYRGRLQDNNMVLIGQGVLNPAVIGENNIPIIQQAGQNTNVVAGEDIVVGYYADGMSFRTLYRAGISDSNYAISNTANIGTMPATPTGTATSIRFACTLWQDF